MTSKVIFSGVEVYPVDEVTAEVLEAACRAFERSYGCTPKEIILGTGVPEPDASLLESFNLVQSSRSTRPRSVMVGCRGYIPRVRTIEGSKQ